MCLPVRKILILCFLSCFLLACGGGDSKTESNDIQETIVEEVEEKKPEVKEDIPEGLSLIKGSDCSACHLENQKLVGPSYEQVAEKYKDDEEAHGKLVTNILEGSSGVWGEIPMAPHPQLTKEQASSMIDYILSLK